MNLKLERFCYDKGTFGHLFLPSGEVLCTVEKPWMDNAPFKSCIPIGVYDVEHRRFNRGGYDALEIMDVKKRTHILFHIGNYVENVVGCVGVNTEFGSRGREWCGLGSKKAFNKLMLECKDENEIMLTITNKQGGVLSKL